MKTNELIQKQREKLGLTLEQVGDFVGVGKSTVRKWESGLIKNMRRDKISKLAEILQLSPLDLMKDNKSESNYNHIEIEKNETPIITTVNDAMLFLLSNPTVSAYGGYDFDRMSDEEKIQFANKVAGMFKVISEEYKNK